MKVCIITPHFLPENTAAANRIYSMANVLSKSNDLKVLSLSERGVDPSNHSDENFNYPVEFIHHKNYNNKNFFLRFYKEFIYAIKLAKKAAKDNPDLIIGTSPFLNIIPALILFGGKSKKIIDLRDLVWVYLPDGLIKKVLTVWTEFFLKKYFEIVVTNETERDWVVNQIGIKNDKIHLVPNGIAKERFDIISNLDYKFKSSEFNVTFVGNVGIAQNLTVLMEVAKELSSINFNIVGGGNDIDNLKKYVSDHGLKNVVFTGKLDWSDLKKYYEESHLLYAQLNEKYFCAMPSKLYEYLSTGLPIVYGGTGQVETFMKSFDKVRVVKPDDSNALKKAILDLQSSVGNERSLDNIYKIKQNYIREDICESYVDLIKNI